ncbi:MAG: ATP-dependent Clp protease ATP-binding subunit, partial [Candidatus Sacchiramonaceae bacterium]|nr:ATP-dependent Clp protease ATP-binding subunit [Candidatus Saccharimonadaceae bacterium]
PYSVVLFDEIEKAHPDTFNLLLQLLEDGELTDAKGRKVSFKNAIVILTSNLGASEMMKESALGFEAAERGDEDLSLAHKRNEKFARRALEKLLRPELLNRFDGIITFHALTKAEISEIFDNLIADLNKRLIHQGLSVKVKASAKKWLIERGFDAKNGARPLRRTIEDQLEHKIAEGILGGEFERGMQLEAGVKAGEIVMAPKK